MVWVFDYATKDADRNTWPQRKSVRGYVRLLQAKKTRLE